MSKKIIILIFIALISAFFIILSSRTKIQNTNILYPQTSANRESLTKEPIDNALARTTKKPFAIKISPNNSPVSPEKFSGYHTGADFETFLNEQEIDINIFAICTGKLLQKKYATGYGGVAVQECQVDNQDITVIYGHLKLDSIATNPNQIINKGQKIGILGQEYSSETDNERKHLHLGIHKGKDINILGYTQDKDELKNWINPLTLIK
ncbi:M23 family metallopeptidase [Candidatus Falkowbacteria bacterium]|nr:M23 family metallopeptidase [Candidatus Falkowbacteria bacterium]